MPESAIAFDQALADGVLDSIDRPIEIGNHCRHGSVDIVLLELVKNQVVVIINLLCGRPLPNCELDITVGMVPEDPDYASQPVRSAEVVNTEVELPVKARNPVLS